MLQKTFDVYEMLRKREGVGEWDVAWVLAIRERGEYGDSFRGLGGHSFSGGLHRG